MPEDSETPRLYLTKQEFEVLLDEKVVPLFEKLDKHMMEVDVQLYALNEMLTARKSLKERRREKRARERG